MTLVDLSDIEDITLLGKGAPLESSNQTVRIRKFASGLRKRETEGDNDCEKGDKCCGGSKCNGGESGVETLSNHCEPTSAIVQSQGDDEGQVTNDVNPAAYLLYLKTWGCSHNNSDSEYMAGLLAQAQYNVTTTDYASSHVVILNSCTVKGPSEQHFKNEIDRAAKDNKRVILAGCVPQSDTSYRKMASVIGVQQIDRIVDVVEETIKGNKVSYMSARRNGVRTAGADLALPKIRKNELIEIIPVSTGCLNNCTYCKTKQARGQLVSYPINSITDRIKHVCEFEGVKEIWLTSEDLGCWGIDIGLTIVDLLNAIVQCLPNGVMLRLGMSNPPYFLQHLEEVGEILSHPNVYEFLHIPVQSGSDSVLLEMKREYSLAEFSRICDFMYKRHPNITIATDIICGYPTETAEDFEDTYELVRKYKFPVLFINQFYPRPGTHAAKLKRIPTDVVKGRTRRLNDLFQSYEGFGKHLVGTTQRVLVTEIAHDGVKYVGHTKSYQQVLIDKDNVVFGRSATPGASIMGEWLDVVITGTIKFALIGGRATIVGGKSTNAESNIIKSKNNTLMIMLLALLVVVLGGVVCLR